MFRFLKRSEVAGIRPSVCLSVCMSACLSVQCPQLKTVLYSYRVRPTVEYWRKRFLEVKLSVNYCHTNTRKKLFSERVVKVWNSLPPSIVTFSSLATFRNSLSNLNLRIYTKC